MKQPAGRDILGNLAPEFPRLNDDVLLGGFGQEKINYFLEIEV